MNIGRVFGIKPVPVNPVCLTVLLLYLLVFLLVLLALGNRLPPNAFAQLRLVGQVVMGRMVGPRGKLLCCPLKCLRFLLSLASGG